MPSNSTTDELPDTSLTPTLTSPSKHEESLLAFFALHRVATPNMIIDAFPRWFTYHQKVMRHLNWLANEGYLIQHEYNDGYVKDGYVYNITDKGYVRCRDFKTIDVRTLPYRYEQPTGVQAEHDLLITKCATSMYESIRKDQGIQLLQEGRYMLSSLNWIDEDTGKEMEPFEMRVPDYWYIVKDQNGLMVRFVEVIVGEESMTRVRQMFSEYERWGQEPVVQEFLRRMYAKWGATQPQPEFQLHCILKSRNRNHTDAWKERMTMMQTFHVDPAMQGRVWTTTKEELERALAEGLSINHHIWHRGKDLMGEKRKRWNSAREGTRTRLVDEYVKGLPTYSLFA